MIFQTHWENLGGCEGEPEPEADERPQTRWAPVDPFDDSVPDARPCCVRGCPWPAEVMATDEDALGDDVCTYWCQECAVGQAGYEPPALYPPAPIERIADAIERAATKLILAKAPSIRAAAKGEIDHWLGVLRRHGSAA